jgi:dipeptidyl aminopeptidase/acylaminoacyl peptidase
MQPPEAGDRLEAPCGSWKSPISSDLIVQGSVGLGQLAFDGDDVLFTEIRPAEKGRSVLVRRSRDGTISDVTPPGFNVRTRVHEYGGGDYVVRDGVVFFSNFADQRVYRQDPGRAPEPLTPESPLRFADYQFDKARERLICVREDKRLVESREDVNTIVALPIAGDEAGGRVLVRGFEFYASPRVSPDGKRLCWLCWNHPDMPWDAAELWVGTFRSDGSIENPVRVAGGPKESIFQPEWAPDGTLYFVSDRTDFWNLYRWRDERVEAVCPREAEFGVPQWVFGLSTYAFVGDNSILCTFAEKGTWKLALLDTTQRSLEVVPSPYTWFSGLRATPPSAGNSRRAAFLAGSPTEPSSLVELDVDRTRFEVLRRSTELRFDDDDLSLPEAIEFPTEGGLSAHAFYYEPKNRRYAVPRGASPERPPLIVKSHGGPTGATTNLFSLAIQYWTTRGFAVLDVNYGGSTGYGRTYRERLNGQWGIVDVDDCVNGAKHLATRGEVDGDRLAITGGSAGGYTTLCALTFRKVFKAGASHFGISDLERLAHDARTGNHHKFESRYEDRLVAPYPDQVEVYRARSPIHFAEQLSCPVIFFQGLDDRIVLPNQAERMVEILRAKRLPVAYIPFEGEGHGFRRAENIKRALDAELYFYSRVFRFEPADPIEPVQIDNLEPDGQVGDGTLPADGGRPAP